MFEDLCSASADGSGRSVMSSLAGEHRGEYAADPSAAVPSVGVLAEDLTAIADALQTQHDAVVQLVDALGRVLGSGICERIHGLSVDRWIRLQARMIGSDVATLVTAADVLPTMPTTHGLFRRGELSWGTVRNITYKVSRRSREERLSIDRRVAATQDKWDGLDGFHPDWLLDAVDLAIAELDDPRDTEKAEDRAVQANFVAIQPAFDGRVKGGFDYDPVNGAILLEALDAATSQGTGQSLAQRRASGLIDIAAAYLGKNAGRPARPLLKIRVDLSEVTATAAGHVVLKTPGMLPTVSAKLLETLAGDADVEATLFDGARPLATVTKRFGTGDVPADVRRAITTRDVADRMPGSDRPIQHLHHIGGRDIHGRRDHHPDGLIGLSHHSHNLLHRHGWRQHLDPETGVFTIRRRGTTWRTVPPGTPLAPDPKSSDQNSTDPKSVDPNGSNEDRGPP